MQPVDTKQAGPRICVVLDTNVWRTEILLNSKLGAALVFAARQSGWLLGLPEVVEDEMKVVMRDFGLHQLSQAQTSLRFLQLLTGEEYAVSGSLYSGSGFDVVIEARLEELKTILFRVPHKEELFKAALHRVLNTIPACAKDKDEYRDCLIWEAVLRLAEHHHVHFVSGDGAFRNRDGKGLNRVLADESKSVHFYTEISDLLSALWQQKKDLDQTSIVARVDHSLRSQIEEAARKKDFVLEALERSELKCFVTENRNVVAVSFKLFYRLSNRTEELNASRPSPQLVVVGETSFLLDSGTIGETIKTDEFAFRWTGPDGKQTGLSDLFIHADLVLFRSGQDQEEGRFAPARKASLRIEIKDQPPGAEKKKQQE